MRGVLCEESKAHNKRAFKYFKVRKASQGVESQGTRYTRDEKGLTDRLGQLCARGDGPESSLPKGLPC